MIIAGYVEMNEQERNKPVDASTLDDLVKFQIHEAYEYEVAGDWEAVVDFLKKINRHYSRYFFPPPPLTMEEIRTFRVQLPTGPLRF